MRNGDAFSRIDARKTTAKMMLLLSICACLMVATTSLPVYGTARYGHPPFAYRPTPAYYRYPFAQTYPEDLYYQPEPILHYPYYPITRPFTKGEVYQALYPYYYSDRLRPYGYYSNENSYVTTDDMQDNLHDERGRSEALPVGQETWFEGESVPSWQSDYDDVNAAFLQNLIVSQMYNDALNKNEQIESDPIQDKQLDSDDYEERKTSEFYGDRDTRDYEDEDVRELKALAGKPLYHVPKTNVYSATNNEKNFRAQQWHHDYSTPSAVRREDHYNDDYPSDEGWINWSSKRSTDKNSKQKMIRSTLAPPTTTTVFSTTKVPTAVTKSGQKEEVLLRPATPVRHPFPEPVLQMLAANVGHKKRTPSVYDTIKQLLSMDESYKQNTEKKTRMQKRFVTTEEDLVGELKGLKRRSPA